MNEASPLKKTSPRRAAVRRWLTYAIVIVAIGAAAAWAFSPRPIAVELQPARLDLFERVVREEAVARVSERFVVSAPVTGLLERPWLRVGDPVATGAIVGAIRPVPPPIRDARTLAELRERASGAEAALMRARANVELARAALERATSEHRRTLELAGRGYVSASVEEQTRIGVVQQTQALRAAEFGAQAAQHELLQAQAALREGQWNDAGTPKPASRVEIRSERAGTVLKILRDSEAVVAAGTTLFELGDVGVLDVVADVLSQDATEIRPGMAVRMRASASAAAFRGTVWLVEPVARTKVSALGIEEQRVSVVIQPVPAAPSGIGEGYRVDVEIVTRQEPDALVVPVGAVFRDRDGWSVYVEDAGIARKRRVQLVDRNRRDAWIATGIDRDERVIVYPPDTLRDGSRVALRG